MNINEKINEAKNIIEHIMETDYETAVMIYNSYCEAIGEKHYSIIKKSWIDCLTDDIDYRFSCFEIDKLIDMMWHGEVNRNDEYIWIEEIDEKSFFRSGNNPLTSEYFNQKIEIIAEYIVRHRNNLEFEEFDVLFETEYELISKCEERIETMIKNNDTDSVVRMYSNFIMKKEGSNFMPIGFLSDNEDVAEFFYDTTLWDVIEYVLAGKVDMRDNYIWLEKGEHPKEILVSGDNPFNNETHKNDIHAMAQYIIKSRNHLYDEDMYDFLTDCGLI